MPDPFSLPPFSDAPEGASPFIKARNRVDQALYALTNEAYDMLVACEKAVRAAPEPSGRPFAGEERPFIWAPWLAGSNALLFGFGIGLGESVDLGSDGTRFDPNTGETS